MMQCSHQAMMYLKSITIFAFILPSLAVESPQNSVRRVATCLSDEIGEDPHLFEHFDEQQLDWLCAQISIAQERQPSTRLQLTSAQNRWLQKLANCNGLDCFNARFHDTVCGASDEATSLCQSPSPQFVLSGWVPMPRSSPAREQMLNDQMLPPDLVVAPEWLDEYYLEDEPRNESEAGLTNNSAIPPIAAGAGRQMTASTLSSICTEILSNSSQSPRFRASTLLHLRAKCHAIRRASSTADGSNAMAAAQQLQTRAGLARFCENVLNATTSEEAFKELIRKQMQSKFADADFSDPHERRVLQALFLDWRRQCRRISDILESNHRRLKEWLSLRDELTGNAQQEPLSFDASDRPAGTGVASSTPSSFVPDVATLLPRITGFLEKSLPAAAAPQGTANSRTDFRARRIEYRQLSDDERRRFHGAVQRLKRSLLDGVPKYDLFTILYNHAGGLPRWGPAFLPFHRELLRQFEIALRNEDPTLLGLPYWDPTLDEGLPNPADSVLWTSELLGESSHGAVIDGPFANWLVVGDSSSDRLLQRHIGESNVSRLLSISDLEFVLNRRNYRELTFCVDGTFEFASSLTHAFLGGHMQDLHNAPNDPIFYMLHAFVDYLWEEWREIQQSRQHRAVEYPARICAQSHHDHSKEKKMKPISTRPNMHGLHTNYTDVFFTYTSRPTCTRDFVERCNSTFLFCDTLRERCLSKVRPGGNCSGLAHFVNACYKSSCVNGICIAVIDGGLTAPHETDEESALVNSTSVFNTSDEYPTATGVNVSEELREILAILRNISGTPYDEAELAATMNGTVSDDSWNETSSNSTSGNVKPTEQPADAWATVETTQMTKATTRRPTTARTTTRPASSTKSTPRATATTTVAMQSTRATPRTTVATRSSTVGRVAANTSKPAATTRRPVGRRTTTTTFPYGVVWFTLTVVRMKRNGDHGPLGPLAVVRTVGQNPEENYGHVLAGKLFSGPVSYPYYNYAAIARARDPRTFSTWTSEFRVEVFDERNRQCTAKCFSTQLQQYVACAENVTRLSWDPMRCDPISFKETEREALESMWTNPLSLSRQRIKDYLRFECPP